MIKVNISAFKLVGLGLSKKTTNEGGQSSVDCGNLWQKFEKENYAERMPGRLSNEIYAVYYNYEGDYTKPFSYFIGCKVSNDAEVPQGMDSLLIPSQQYIKVISKGKMPDCIVNSWKDIWHSEINRAYKYDFEVYNERSKDWNNAAIDIFISST
jgi:predicted transcriptional regulator YdeE